MKQFLALVLLVGLPWSFARSQVLFTAKLDGSQESPPVVSTGEGTAWAVLSPDMKTLTFRVTYARLNSARTGAHFHAGGTGGGSVVFPLSFIGNTVSGTWTTLPDSIVRHLFKGDIYVNVHSSTSPAGEIRGYLHIAQGVGYTVAMDGSQESPPTTSTGQGTGWVVLDSVGARLTYNVTVAGLTDTLKGAHFHTAPQGTVVKPITFVDSTSDGVWTGFVDSILTALTKGNLYVNVHTKTYPGGELRGTVTPVGTVTFTARIDGSQENPPVASTGTGTAWGVLSADMQSMTYRATYARLSGPRTGAHFHAGGTAGGAVVLPLSFSGNTVSGTWSSLPDSIVRHLLREEVYINFHTGAHPAGEIRGYLHVAQGVGYTVAMDGSQESPPTTSTGQGTGWVVLDSVGARLTYNVTVAGLTDTLKGAHFHTAPQGTVVKPITFVDSTSDGVWTGFVDSILTALTKGNLYVNVHTKTYPGGELRGGVQYSAASVSSVEVVSNNIPASFTLEQNYPNPFNPSTRIRFELDKASTVTLKVYNVIGQEVASLVEGAKAPGTYDVLFDARALASGVYFYRLITSGGIAETRKMVLLK